ncbi:MAG: DUF309 domain-containing protein [Bradyrhizobium sp.]|uniref:DUF309 domain-containing protein n=1 Tax=Bradyrhizobium sp. TaxID=376 RepID=UPI0025C2D913|nr:DUF309 domain-containing protein [Bradyrhizobium sp.]MBI5262726.1 DUF309 domain-containing protein [Bradyrhizobium sp.]
MTTVLAGQCGSMPPEVRACDPFAWAELADFWDAGDFRAVHDWLGLRWNHLIQTRPGGHADKDARFLQALAFAALAFHFTQNQKQDGAALVADDALSMLPGYLPLYRGLDVAPVIATLSTLRPLLEGLAPEDDCPMRPFTFNRLSYTSPGS